MYEDYTGQVIVATKDKITTIEDYAKFNGIDVEKYDVLRMEVTIINRANIIKFYCESKNDQSQKNIEFDLIDESFFKLFAKTTKLIFENESK